MGQHQVDNLGSVALALGVVQPVACYPHAALHRAATIPAGRDGDVYLLRLILHDWNDADSAAILSNIRRAMGPARATLVIAEVLWHNALAPRCMGGNAPALSSVQFLTRMTLGLSYRDDISGLKQAIGKFDYCVVHQHLTRSLAGTRTHACMHAAADRHALGVF